ncbi:hypothetical protein CMI37_24695 [Candidatus Pacearchaeota archaeon]|nr:hypothetical protein [Candidatus Pacearchaeota archaeon]|tara:strand:+ start:10857 stop:11525 length:669 start_codon:yes stop_codon:yes gene_type:complete
MSLIDQATAGSPHKLRMSETAGKKVGPPKIIRTTEFMSLIRGVLDENLIDKKTRKEWKNYRTRLKKAHWPLEGLTNKIDAKLWKHMCSGVLKAMVKNIRNSQPNGEWRLGEYEIDIRPNPNGDESIILACKWIDANNAQDLRYHNGVPAVDVNINMADANRELIEVLTKKKDSSNDDELKDLMKQFISVMAGNAIEKKSIDQKAEEQKAEESIDEIAEAFEG